VRGYVCPCKVSCLLNFFVNEDFGVYIKAVPIYRTAKGNPPVTFSIAACETQNVSVSVLPSFGLSEGSNITAKGMWSKMVKVLVGPPFLGFLNNIIVVH